MSFDQWDLFYKWFMAWIRLAAAEFAGSMIMLILLPMIGFHLNTNLWIIWTFRIIFITLVAGVIITFDTLSKKKSEAK